jgi:hypothetical protein
LLKGELAHPSWNRELLKKLFNLGRFSLQPAEKQGKTLSSCCRWYRPLCALFGLAAHDLGWRKLLSVSFVD